jgi:hypothetical protein
LLQSPANVNRVEERTVAYPVQGQFREESVVVDALHEDNLQYIEEREVRMAYLYLVRFAERLEGFRCRPHQEGLVRTFRYCQGTRQPFAFIVNRHSLTFQFRKPALEGPGFDGERRLSRFAGSARNHRGEVTVRIEDLLDAKLVMAEAFGSESFSANEDWVRPHGPLVSGKQGASTMAAMD